jgi:type II secretory ATPase GspE/PulE/Tfp pilus assembly ATPase PilB-like protein
VSDELRDAAQGPLAGRLPSRYLEEHVLLPLRIAPGGELVVAAGKPVDPTVTDQLSALFQARVQLVDAPPQDIQAAILGARGATEAVPSPSGNGAGETALGDLRAQANDAPVVQLVNATLSDAMRVGASDVHLESTRDGLRVRMRLDGVLRDVASYAREYLAGTISRVKLLASLDIAERRLPQDGRARLRLGAREIDVRVSTLPSLHGESVVLRLLDHAADTRDLSSLGMPNEIEARFAAVLGRTTGLVLVTGPTGSGKTTTLYSALSRLNTAGVKIVTVEDPVEYQLPGITQVPVQRKAGLGFANVLRSILRHDPDIVMVGEMRDRETAEVAVQASLTGHLVFSTLHTNDAPGGVTRLVDMGIEPYLVAATVQAILAQRLVRLLCPACSRRATSSSAPVGRFNGGGPVPAREAVGCDRCGNTGYRGRTGLYELCVPDEEMRNQIASHASLTAIRTTAGKAGMRSLADAGWDLVARGVTTADEVLRVTSSAESR